MTWVRIPPGTPNHFDCSVRHPRISRLLRREKILLRAELSQDFRPHGRADLTHVRFPHWRHRWADAAPDRKRNPIFEDRALVRKRGKSSCFENFKLLPECLLRNSDPIELSSWRRFVTGFQTSMSPFSPCVGWPRSGLVSWSHRGSPPGITAESEMATRIRHSALSPRQSGCDFRRKRGSGTGAVSRKESTVT